MKWDSLSPIRQGFKEGIFPSEVIERRVQSLSMHKGRVTAYSLRGEGGWVQLD